MILGNWISCAAIVDLKVSYALSVKPNNKQKLHTLFYVKLRRKHLKSAVEGIAFMVLFVSCLSASHHAVLCPVCCPE